MPAAIAGRAGGVTEIRETVIKAAMKKTTTRGRWLLAIMFVCLLGLGETPSLVRQPTPGGAVLPDRQSPEGHLEVYTETISGTLVTFEMIPVPGGTVRIPNVEATEGVVEVEVGPFWIGKTEVTWDEYDVWMLGLDQEASGRNNFDAESRPSSPYGAPDRGFGHTGFAAMSLSYHSAEQYGRWLSEKTGRNYRLPTAVEWEHACNSGLGLDAIEVEALEELAWYRGNSARAAHPVGSKSANSLGLFDMLGNVGEWATPIAGEPTLHGGSYLDEAHDIGCNRRAEQTSAWNASDPQIPQSRWWLADAPFAGFRIVREPETGGTHE